MPRLWMCMLTSAFVGGTAAYAEPLVFHSETFSDRTTVTMELTSNEALSRQDYDFGVTIKLIETDETGSVTYHDNGRHKALVQCHANPGKLFVGGREYVVTGQLASTGDEWKRDLWRAVCLEPPLS
jgi:hypothetical protein